MTIRRWLLVLVGLLVIVPAGFFRLAPTYVEKAQNRLIPNAPRPVSEAAQSLHDTLLIADMHADSLLWNRDLLERSDYGHVDIPRLREGNVAVQFFTTVTKSPRGLNYRENAADAPDNITALAVAQAWPPATWNSLTARALHQADKLHGFAERAPESLVILKTRADLTQLLERRQRGEKVVGGVLGTEGSHALDGELTNIEVLYDTGFRMMSLHHFFDNRLGGSLHGTGKAGLTPFGREVVKRIVEKKIILDVSHSSPAVVSEVLALVKAPVVVSHTGLAGHCETPRNISDELMQRIAERGGLIGIGFWSEAVCDASPKGVVSALRYGIDLVGENHIALGSDFDGAVTTHFDSSELVLLTEEMLQAEFTETEIRKVMGENLIRFLEKHLPEKEM